MLLGSSSGKLTFSCDSAGDLTDDNADDADPNEEAGTDPCIDVSSPDRDVNPACLGSSFVENSSPKAFGCENVVDDDDVDCGVLRFGFGGVIGAGSNVLFLELVEQHLPTDLDETDSLSTPRAARPITDGPSSP